MLYREEDVQTIAKIKSLLFEKKMSVEQAKQMMSGNQVETTIAEVKSVKQKTEKVIKVEKTPKTQSSSSELLVSAREKLSKILLLTETLKKTHHWN